MSHSNTTTTFALPGPSPTHSHVSRMNVASAVRNLRRSLSRSPSKFNVAARSRAYTTIDGPVSNASSPQSPCRRYSPALVRQGSEPQLSHSPTPIRQESRQYQQSHTPIPFQSSSSQSQLPLESNQVSTPLFPQQTSHTPSFAPSSFSNRVKLSLRAARHTTPQAPTPSLPLPRPRVSPKSPLKRALSLSSDSANSVPSPAKSGCSADGQENSSPLDLAIPTSPLSRRGHSKPATRHSVHLDVSGGSHSIFKSLDGTSDFSSPPSGALKRSDATMDLETGTASNPVAKRRSLHGISGLSNVAYDSSVFDASTTTPKTFDIHDDSNQEYQLAASPAVPLIRRETQPSPTPGPSSSRRSTSLRRSTLQQRQVDKSSWGRKMGAANLAQMTPDSSVATANAQNRPRLSNDHFTPPSLPRFSGTGNLPPTPFMQFPAPPQPTHPSQPHPLSRSLRPSESGNNFLEDTPMKFADFAALPRKPRLDPFRHSLSSFPSNAGMGTPANAAFTTGTPSAPFAPTRPFMSAGLISKVNREPEEDKDKGLVVPDTPCKKNNHHSSFATYPPAPGSAARLELGPATPAQAFKSSGIDSLFSDRPPATFGNFNKGSDIFRRTGSRSLQRGSVLNLEEDMKQSPDTAKHGRFTPDHPPPSPSKFFLTPSAKSNGDDTMDSPSINRRIPPPISAVKPFSFARAMSPIQPDESPKTPQDDASPLGQGCLSVNKLRSSTMKQIAVPVTPTSASVARRFVTPVRPFTKSQLEMDEHLVQRYSKVEEIGRGEFSTVYRVSFPKSGAAALSADGSQPLAPAPPGNALHGEAYAVKKIRRPYNGPRDRSIRMREVRALKAMRNARHVIQHVNDWEIDNYLYIQTEYCDEGSLSTFLSEIGRTGRLDDFRIWKILHDVLLGVQEIHKAGFIHLDLKPANVLITFEGVLKIGDFGLAAEWPVLNGVPQEGDREYMGPEILKGQFDKPADIFSLGLITLEIAANVSLPNNGASWTALRSGDFRDVPTLTTATGTGEATMRSSLSFEEALSGGTLPTLPAIPTRPDFGTPKNAPLSRPPPFMADASHALSLDQLVRDLTRPEPKERPTVDEILELESLRWVASRRRGAATVYEGPWGPDDVVTGHVVNDVDTEMLDA